MVETTKCKSVGIKIRCDIPWLKTSLEYREFVKKNIFDNVNNDV